MGNPSARTSFARRGDRRHSYARAASLAYWFGGDAKSGRTQPPSELKIVVASARAVLQPVQQNLGNIEPIRLAEGQEITFDELPERLVELGYTHVDVVAKRGHFAIRGGIVDIFPASEELPVRVDFWGDEVSEVRAFSVGISAPSPTSNPAPLRFTRAASSC